MFCPKCGSKNDKSSLFCGKCGQPLNVEPAQTPPLPPSPGKTKRKLKPFWKFLIVLGSIIVFLVIVFLVAYAAGWIQIITPKSETEIPQQASLPPTDTPVPMPSETPLPPTSTPRPTHTIQVVPTLDRNASLADGYEWLVYVTEDEGIMAVNQDGGGPNQVSNMPLTSRLAGTFDIPNGINPYYGDILALRMEDQPGYWIEILELPSLEIKASFPIISEASLAGVTKNDDLDIDLHESILDPLSIRWSPNGRYLAFAGALDGPSTDLYVYDMETAKVIRLSSGSLHVATPYWTSDSKRIFYQAVETFGSGAGWTSRSTWVVDLASKETKKLYEFTDSTSSVTPLGITTDDYLLLHTFSQSKPDLRFVNLDTGAVNILYQGWLQTAILLEDSGAVIFVGDDGCVNFVASPTAPPRCLGTVPVDYTTLLTDEASVYVITQDGVYEIDFYPTSEGIGLVEEGGVLKKVNDNYGFPVHLDYPGLSCFPGIVTVCSTLVIPVDNDAVFFIDESNLFYMSTSDMIPILVDEDIMPASYGHKRNEYENIGWMYMPG